MKNLLTVGLLFFAFCSTQAQSILNKDWIDEEIENIYAARPLGREYNQKDEENIDPYDPQSYFEAGKRKMEEGDYEGAIKEFEQSIELTEENLIDVPDRVLGSIQSSSAEYNMALCYVELEGYDEAIFALQTCIEKNPISLSTYHFLSHVFLLNEEPDEAIEVLEKALEIKSDNPTTLHNIAYCYFMKSDYTKAMNYLNENLKIHRDYLKSYNLKAKIVEIRSGNVIRMNGIYNIAVRHNMDNPDAYFLRGVHFFVYGRFTEGLNEARADFVKAIELKGDSIFGNALIALIDFRRGKFSYGFP